MSRLARLVAALALVLSFLADPARAQAPLQRPQPLVRMAQLAVRVEIVDGVGTTTLRQAWRNDGNVQAEATWILPLPPGAVADGFRMTVNGVEMSGEVLDAARARSVYEGIVRQRLDPGLLEWFGRGCLRARIFPIPPHGEVSADVSFRQILPELDGLRRWSFALRAAGAEGLAPERVVLDLALSSKKAIKNAWSPLTAVQVIQKDDHSVRASFEGAAAALGEGELALYYGLSEAEFGLDLLTHRPAPEGEGTFLLLISPKREWQRQETLKKSIVFVVDTSGSMEGKKMEQARGALRLFLGSLAPDDRFDVVPFATEPEPFFGQRVPATPGNVAQAMDRADHLVASGGTNIAGALEAALAGTEADGRVPMIVFLTDGEPTVGTTDTRTILDAVAARNAGKNRLFVFGVGNDVRIDLLDELARKNGGARDYVREQENLEEKARALFTKLSHPVMTELTLSIDGLPVSKVVPAALPDLFAGDRLEVLGRYLDQGAHAIRLAGVVSGVRREFVYEGSFPARTEGATAFVSSLWAERRVGVLLDAIRLNGTNPELVAEVERLGRDYRIVTPYTSHLVVEPGLRTALRDAPASSGAGGAFASRRASGEGDGAAWYLGQGEATPALDEFAARLAAEGLLPAEASPAQQVELARAVAAEVAGSERRMQGLGQAKTGAGAVDDSRYLDDLMRRGSEGGRTLLELLTRRVQDKTFTLRNGVWTDQSLRADFAGTRRRVAAFSPEYFALLAERPALAPYFALGTRLVVELGGEVFEVVPG